MKKQSFIHGAIILMIANAISKILGAVLKIPLTYILNEEGMAVYNTAFNVYVMFLSFIISGLPFAVAKLVSEYNTKNDKRMVRAVVRLSSYILLVLGFFGSAALFFGAEFFALAMKEEQAVFAIAAISPSVFLVAAGTAYKSYFQGVSNMTPTALSQVIEAVVKLLLGFYFASIMSDFGTQMSAGGAVSAVTAGELIATLMLFFVYAVSKKEKYICTKEEKKEILSKLGAVAVPLLMTSVISSMLSVVDTTIVRSRLIDFFQSSDEARWAFGAYTGYALTVLHLPVGILATLGVSILPVIAGNISVGRIGRARQASELALRIIIILALPCTVAVCFMSEDILDILFNNTTSAKMLSLASPCILFLCVSQILTAIMQSAGKIFTTFACASVGMAIKLILSYILIGKFGIYGGILSADISYFIVMLLNLWQIKRVIGLKYKISQTLIKPFLCGFGMCAVIYMLYPVIKQTLKTPVLSCIALGSWSGVVYILLLMLSGTVSIKEIRKTIEKA